MAKQGRPTVRVHDLATDEIIDREMNDDEFAEWQARQEAVIAEESAAAAAEAKKQTILEALASATGFSAEELREALNA